jgi:serine/threonine protein kinase
MFCPVDGAKLARPADEMITLDIEDIVEHDGGDAYIGKVIQGRYKVLRRIGEGGMGVVYVAEHVEIEKKVALKVLRDDYSKRPEVVDRFRQEARSASKIGHPHIVDVTDFGQLEDGGVYFVMEFLSGCGLNEICRGEQVPLVRAVTIIEQIARALKAAHEKGIVHRDMKPENVFLIKRDEREDFVKILDFGIAKISDRDNEGKRLTKTGMIFGTPEYMSPEQAVGKKLRPTSDIYSFGIVIYEMLTGEQPHRATTPIALLQTRLETAPPSPRDIITDLDPKWNAAVLRCLQIEPEDRFQSVSEILSALFKSDVGHQQQLANGNAQQKLTVRNAIEQGDRSLIGEILEIVRDTGALAYTMDQARQQAKLAKQALVKIEDNPYKAALVDLAEFSVTRGH